MSYTWILDNGHGVNTPGKRSPKHNGKTLMFEYEFNRAVVNLLACMLNKENIDYHILVPELQDISLEERVRRANKLQSAKGNCILISIHGNAFNNDWNKAEGIEIFTTIGETKSDVIAEKLYKHYEENKFFKNSKLRKDTTDGDSDKENNFYIIRNTRMPAILSENGFMTNLKECQRMLTYPYREEVARTHFNMIKEINSIKL